MRRGWAVVYVEAGHERFVEDDLRALDVISYVPNEDGLGRSPALSRGWLLVWLDPRMAWNAIERTPDVRGVRETPDGDIEVVSLDTVAAIRSLERLVWAAVRAERRGGVAELDQAAARDLFGDIGELLSVARRAVAARGKIDPDQIHPMGKERSRFCDKLSLDNINAMRYVHIISNGQRAHRKEN